LRRLARRFRVRPYLIDPNFLRYRHRYLLQCCFVSLAMLGVLLMLDSVYQTVLIAALGASCFIAFAAPSMRRSRPRCLIGGYLVGVLVGCSLAWLAAVTDGLVALDEDSLRIILGAVSVGLAMFLMVITDTEHPPGAAVALGFVLNDWQPLTIVVVMTGIVAISVIKELARDHLMDLF
jgi:CBS-domain-containing membrane protein